ncbi:hypothetical protein ACF09J_26745 [Streptomyces sp. NPDC014889]|uniref:hypothetical protein n=1 Tax=Streptomyces sp. NPDC014889 TaxID=3364928 RepID=UPI0036FF83B8
MSPTRTVDELVARRLLVADGARLRPTEAGRELLAAVGAETAPHTGRIWDGIPAEDLAAAGRVPALVTERASTDLAALSARARPAFRAQHEFSRRA